jgi:D-glycero-alpha-D-manno-heptose-7-phosphate kinase
MDNDTAERSSNLMDQLEDFLVPSEATIRVALARIDQNQHGIIIATGPQGEVVGVATDGDIRRALLDGRTLDDPVRLCVNCDFHWVGVNTPHENVLKQLDRRVKLVPVLDGERRLRGIVSRDHLPARAEERIYARARAPVRVSFGGGGSDLTHYFVDGEGAVINTTISLYSHATLRVRDDSRISVDSLDLGERFEADDLAAALAHEGRFGLFQALLRVVRPEFGFDLFLHSDFPMGSGLGGSAAVSTSVLGCLNMMRRDRWDNHEIAEIAFQAERLHLGIAGGWQDQYATAFGGFNFMEFTMHQNVVHPLRVHPDVLLELEESLVLCDTGIAHHSGDIHQHQRKAMQAEDVKRQVKANVALTYELRNHLLRGRLTEFGHSLHEAWQLKRQFSSMISNDQIDATYDGARQNGAIGGKLLGAGGGGFFIFYSPPFLKHKLITFLKSRNLRVHPFRFEPNGLQAWSVREGKNSVLASH